MVDILSTIVKPSLDKFEDNLKGLVELKFSEIIKIENLKKE